MICYSIKRTEIESKVSAIAPTWAKRAQKHTKGLKFPPIWSEIKSVFMEVQHDKCAYCERQIGSKEHGRVEFDVEHFRPKGAVVAWGKVPSYMFPIGASSPTGYTELAYHLANYAVACKTCNSGLKNCHFPIEGSRDTAGDDPATLNSSEKPLLLFPIGDTVDDPRDLIRFQGVIPVVVNQDASHYDNHRAQVTIDFFDLLQREDLLRERSRYIISLYFVLLAVQQSFPLSDRALLLFLSDSHPHTNCLNCFKKIFDTNQPLATQYAIACVEYLESNKAFDILDYLPMSQYAED